LIAAAWVIERYSRGYTGWRLAAEVPWVWITLGIVGFVVLRWFVSRGELTPEVAAAIEQAAVDRAVCRHCGKNLKADSITCSSCGRIVNWASLVGAMIGVLFVFGWILRAVFSGRAR